MDEWLGLFDDPILGNSALDRLAHGAHQLVLEGPSYRARLAPKARRQPRAADGDGSADGKEVAPPTSR